MTYYINNHSLELNLLIFPPYWDQKHGVSSKLKRAQTDTAVDSGADPNGPNQMVCIYPRFSATPASLPPPPHPAARHSGRRAAVLRHVVTYRTPPRDPAAGARGASFNAVQ